METLSLSVLHTHTHARTHHIHTSTHAPYTHTHTHSVRLLVVKAPLADNTAQGSVLVLIKFSGNNPKAEDCLVSQQAGKRSIIQQSNRVQGRSIQTQNPTGSGNNSGQGSRSQAERG